MLTAALAFIQNNQQKLIQTYRELHLLAEPSWQEEITSRFISERLEKVGLKITKFPGHFGFTADIAGDSGDVVGVRADMDALVQEVDGVVRANHSCGHDAHCTMVMYSALAIALCDIRPRHTIRFLFQPAEEKGEGALQMIRDGALDGVKFLLGVHLRPEGEVPYGKASPVILHGANATISGLIKGMQAHASRPQDGINPIEAASFLIQALNGVRLQTSAPFSVKMTQLRSGGDASNVIPESAKFSLDLRAGSNAAMEELQQAVFRAIHAVEKLTGANIHWSVSDFTPAASPKEAAIQLAEEAIVKILGKENLVLSCTSQGAEDFHFYTAHDPGLVATMIGLGCGLKPGLHHPHMTFQVDALVYGTKILTYALLKAASRDWS